LQWRQPARQWVLKSPDHVNGLEALFAVFPDALVIQTHRNPMEVLRSLVQLNEVLRGLFCRPGDREQLFETEAKYLAGAMERFIQFRDAHPELADRFVDVTYTDLAADPLAVIARIYRQFQKPLTEVATQRMRRLAEHRSRYSGSRTAPKLADKRPKVSAQAARFDNYCRRFGITGRPAGTL
jgi:hypothetical protein